jgi:amino acid adenylation domain-containing protein
MNSGLPVEDIYPLSPLQQGMMFHSLYAPKSRAYFHQYTCALKGDLDLSAFKMAWQRLIDRHTILRSALEWEELDEPVQIVHRGVGLPIEFLDWRATPSAEREREVESFLETDRELGFELSRAPLMRLSVIRLEAELHLFVWSYHHLLLDGWSVSLVLKEVFLFYEAYRKNREIVIEKSLPYREYIAWLGRQDSRKAEEYWREGLKGFSKSTKMWPDRGAGGLPSQEEVYEELHLNLDREATAELSGLARRHHLTMNTILQGAWGLLLSRYSGDEDVLFGVTIAGRPADLQGVESMIGLFINTLALRIRIDPDNSALDWLKLLQCQQIEMQEYSYSPLTQVHGWSDVPRGEPLFETLLAFQNFPFAPISEETFSGLEVTDVKSYQRHNLPLAVVVTPGQVMRMGIIYDYSRYDHDVIERALRHLKVILEAVSQNPEAKVGELSLLSRVELQEILLEWNRTESEYESQRRIHELIEDCVDAGPDAIAVVYEEQEVSYRELNSRANQLARHLQGLGVGPETKVGICLNRSAGMIEAALGVLKAGAAYVPLDPAYPLERLTYMLEDARVLALISEGKLAEKFPMYEGEIVSIDKDREIISSYGVDNLDGGATAGNLAYVIYTSGSTGLPKGVGIEHRGLCNASRAQARMYGLTTEDRVLQFASLSFDASAFEIMLALTAGASLYMASRELLRSGLDMIDFVESRRITAAVLPPSALGAISWRKLPALKTLIVAGEACPADVVELWGAGRRFINAYGPTESTIWATAEECEERKKKPAIGKPIHNTQVYLLDAQAAPAPVGVAGELYISGVGLARGYMNRADLTAERFIPNPYGGRAGERMYRTGDLCRYRPDGKIDFIGRKDHQVKARGYRIELGEIESALGRHPAVDKSVVMLREGERGAAQLVVSLIATTEYAKMTGEMRNHLTDELRSYLKESLPEYMIPAAFVVMEEMPLLPNGKLNTKALPDLEAIALQSHAEYVPPGNAAEEAMARIWSEVLGVGRIGASDNFFALGGDSILAIRLMAIARENGFAFSLYDLFRHQTVGALARMTEGETVAPADLHSCRPFQLISEEDWLRLPGDVLDAYPLTMLQAGMVFHNEYSPDTYHHIHSLHLRIHVDYDALRLSLKELVARHPALRTSFDLTTFSQPLQLVHGSAQAFLGVDDLRHLSSAEQERAIAEWIETERGRIFNWNDYPLARFQVHRRADDVLQFTFSAPHALIDGWSVSVFFTELFRSYFSSLRGELDSLEPPPRVTFANYVALEQEALSSDECNRYWSTKLSGQSVPALPCWSNAPAASDQPPQTHLVVPISVELSDALKQLAELAKVSLKSLLLAGHFRVLSFLTGKADVITGLVSDGRPEAPGGERIIGLFLNTLPLRLRLEGGAWIDLLQAAFAAEAETIPHRRYPLARIQRDHGGQSFFSTAFNFTNFHNYKRGDGFEGAEVLGATGFGKSNMALVSNFGVDPRSDRLTLTLSGDPAQLCDKLLEAIRNYYVRALTLMVRDPLARYETASLLTASEEQELLIECNETSGDYPREKCLHEWFEEQAEAGPDRIAAAFGEDQVSYRELNNRANQLARYLEGVGVGPEAVVPVCLGRSIEQLVGLLGVLKTGGAYLPLDPSYPRERLAYTIEDAGARILLTERAWLERLPEMAGEVICLDRRWDRISRESQERIEGRVFEDNLAYVIYTSGSTGSPKGAMVTQKGLKNYLNWAAATYGLKEGGVTPVHTPIGFDLTVTSLYPALLVGGRVEMVREGEGVEGLVEGIRRGGGYNLLKITPSHLEMLKEEIGGGRERVGAEVVVVGGEMLTRESVRWLVEGEGKARVINEYGPTETVVGCCVYEVEEIEGDGGAPIGRPIANTQLYVLDHNQQPVPAGVAGELYIGGVGVGRGYLNRQSLSAEKFVPDPFCKQAGARLYRSGDLARWTPDRNLEFLGRIDQQVKIRGYRIEPGEIEAVLNRQPGVQQAVVEAREDEPGQKRLVAYVVGEEEPGKAARLRAALRQSLPDYMTPGTFVFLKAMPLTHNGKLDRKALPRPEPEQGEGGTAYVTPRTPTEEILVGIWEWVLKREGIGIHDNFFDLDGHSLLATQVMVRLRKALGVELPLKELFENATVADLAARVAQIRQAPTSSPTARISQAIQTAERAEQEFRPPLTRVSREAELPLSFAQLRLWFIDQIEPGNASYNCPLAVRLRGWLNVQILEEALNEIIARHETLRTTFSADGGKPKQLIGPASKVDLVIENLSGLTEEDREAAARQLVIKEVERPFNLRRGPLVRVKVLKLAEEDHVMALVTHHIVSDAWSTGVLIDELLALYKAYSEGEPSPLPELEIQYADYAYWQRRYLRGETLDKLLEYWRKQLGGELPALKLPTDRPQPEVRSHRGAHEHMEFSPGLTREIKALSRREGATLFMTLLAAFNILLSRYSGQEDIIVGTAIGNRNSIELERLIGFFINALPLRTDLSCDPTFRELLARVREVALGAYAYQDVPFEKLVDELQPERSLDHAPLFRASFVLQNAPTPTVHLPGLTLDPFVIESGMTKMDLSMTMAETRSGLIGVLEYNTDLFDDTTMKNMLAHFQTLLESIVEGPDQPISSLRLRSDAENEGRRLLDFPDIHMSQKDFENLLMEIDSAPGIGAP